MGSPVSEYLESTEVVGGSGEGGDKYGGSFAESGDVIQVNTAVGGVIWHQYLGGDVGHSKSTTGIPSSGIQTDCGDDSAV